MLHGGVKICGFVIVAAILRIIIHLIYQITAHSTHSFETPSCTCAVVAMHIIQCMHEKVWETDIVFPGCSLKHSGKETSRECKARQPKMDRRMGSG